MTSVNGVYKFALARFHKTTLEFFKAAPQARQIPSRNVGTLKKALQNCRGWKQTKKVLTDYRVPVSGAVEFYFEATVRHYE
jgi:hypothetical protein